MATDPLVRVALFLPLAEPYTYSVPAQLAPRVRRGCRVVVPLGRRQLLGLVVELDAEPAGASIKAVLELLDDEPVLEDSLLDLVLWVAEYYRAPPGEALRTALPTVLHARHRQVLRLTPEGRRLLGCQDALLRSADDDLTPKERELLNFLQSKGGSAAARTLERAGASSGIVTRLVNRGVLSRGVKQRGALRPRTDLLVELNEPLDLAALSRAPRQVALVELVRQAGGRARLSQLREQIPGGARTVAQRLAAKGLARVEVVEIPRDPLAAEPVELDRPPVLNQEQQAALDTLLASADQGGIFAPYLLFGVTSSGKTEIYLRLIAVLLGRGLGALVLVPEISLTPQLAARFRARFGRQVAVLHSGLTDAERYSAWRLIHSGQVRIVVGARSAVFAPLSGLGVVVVDEEHDPSFKQEEGVRYNARDVALVRAQQAGALAVLGSATPSLESFQGTQTGRLGLLRLRHRATPRPLPEVQVVDLRRYQTDREGVLSAPLGAALEQTLAQGEQAILFLNRRGFSPFVQCKECGHAFRCDHCSVTLTFHRSLGRMICHYCGSAAALPPNCPECTAEKIGMLGLGTERVEQVLLQRFAGARVARLDRDTAQRNGLRQILARMARREVDILVGTQMVTKGHDFPDVTLVGVICADLGLHFPDFRAAERTFQLLTQVAGRAGRGERPGRVLIQTYSPDHPSLRWAQQHQYEAFYAEEIKARAELSYPPTGYLAAVHLDGPDGATVERAARKLAGQGERFLKRQPPASRASLLGPTAAPIQKLKDRVRWMLLVRARTRKPLRQLVQALASVTALPKGVRVTVDIDPISML